MVQTVFYSKLNANRIWDVENKRKQKTVIVVKSKDRGARTKITSCGYSTDGKLIGGSQWSISISFVGFSHPCSVSGWSHSHVAVKLEFCQAQYDH